MLILLFASIHGWEKYLIEQNTRDQKTRAKFAVFRKESRKAQLTGGSTLVISLPSQWVKAVGIKPKDEIYISPQPDLSLLLTHRFREEKSLEGTIETTANTDDEEILRIFLAYYDSGFDSIQVNLGEVSSQARSRFKARVREKLIGVEIVEESADLILIQCLQGYYDLPLKKALDRMSVLTDAMQKDSVEALLSNNLELAKQVVERDDEVDRFSHFISRQLNLAVHNRMMIEEIGLSCAQDCINYRLIAKSIERTADHAVQIANSSLLLGKVKFPTPLEEHIRKLSKSTSEFYASTLQCLRDMNSRDANANISKLKHILKEERAATEELVSCRLDSVSVASLRLALESLRRMAEYSTDICELVVNLTVGSPI